VQRQTKKQESRLGCSFKGKPYQGAAHGTTGVLYMLLKAMQVVPEMQQNRFPYVVLESTL
jgi:hypothetical protein